MNDQDQSKAESGGAVASSDLLCAFVEFPKITRLSRDCIITEKLDGTNAQVCITEDGQMLMGSRTRWITPEQDNYGFARWAAEHRDELMALGVGRHFGEWWGQGIQRKYGMAEKRWSLFNVSRWCLHGQTPKTFPTADPRVVKTQDVLPPCVGLVPTLFEGPFTTANVEWALKQLEVGGSVAAPGFKDPEGIVVFHTASGTCFEKTIKGDEKPKTACT